MQRAIALIGMPGAGKSTVGLLLARRLGRRFLDTDELIEQRTGASLQQIVDHGGQDALRAAEEAVLITLDPDDAVIATGGSAVYSEPGMEHLRRLALVVYLDVGMATLRERLANFDTRGVVRRPGQGLEELWEERRPLYERYADLRVDGTGPSAEAVVARIEALIAQVR